MVETRITLKGLEEIQYALGAAASNKQKPLMKKLGVAMVGIVDRNFEAEGRPSRWKKRGAISQANLAIGAQNQAKKTKRYATAKAKLRASILRKASLKSMSGKILSRSGELKQSITFVTEDTRVIIGPGGGLPYARIHQLGGIIVPKRAKALAVPCGKRILRLKKVTMPARPYLIVPRSEVNPLARLVAAELGKATYEKYLEKKGRTP